MEKAILNKHLKAGKIAAQVRDEGAKKLSVEGTSFLEVMDYCEKKIVELKGEVAWAQMAVNDVAAHYCPEEGDESVSRKGDLIKIDIGVHIDGNLADTAKTVEVSGSDKHKDLIKASQNALEAALKMIKPGVKLWELGEAQIKEAEKLGFTTVRNLCGHSLGRYKVHDGISVPTFNNKDNTELKEGMTVAIEPFVTNGDGLVKNKGSATVFMIDKEKGVRSPYAKKILEFVKPRKGLPFTLRDLTREFGKGAALLGLRELKQSDIVKEYPPLAEVSGGMVAQSEHSVIVTKDGCIVYTKT